MEEIFKKLTLSSILSFFSANRNYYVTDKEPIKDYKMFMEKNEKNMLSRMETPSSYENMLNELMEKRNITDEEIYYLIKLYTKLS